MAEQRADAWASPSVAWIAALAALGALAVAVRANNVFRYPSDWGFDASFNWRYIYRMSQDWAIPNPAAGWSTGDPPLYFAVSGALFWALDQIGLRDASVWVIPLQNALLGLAIVALAVRLVTRVDPGNTRRAALAGLLLLFLPAHVHMSAMVNEEMLASALTSLAIYLVATDALPRPHEPSRKGLARAAGAGVAAGLALLTKLSGALAIAAAATGHALDGRLRSTRSWQCAIVVVLAASLAGGWYFARNRVLYGYFQPFGLPAHELMFSMPPGERSLADYVRVPLSTWTNPQLLDPDLLRSVWGSTYASVWFDAHRSFLPHDDTAVRRLGTVTLVLALLPTAAFVVGTKRGLWRAWRRGRGPDLALCVLTVLTLAGYAFYSFRNPWFATLKGTTLLPLSLPFAYHASEVLDDWMRRGRVATGAIAAVGLALAVAVSAGSAFDVVFEKTEVSGLPWQVPAAPEAGPSSPR